jgi:hypothetical protein
MAFLKGRHSDDKPITTGAAGAVILQGRSHAFDGGCSALRLRYCGERTPRE